MDAGMENDVGAMLIHMFWKFELVAEKYVL